MSEFLSHPLAIIALSSISPIAVGWILKQWISTRLTSSINHEYNTLLEGHRKEMQADLKEQQRNLDIDLKRQQNALDARLQAVRHQHEVSQTRTSLFFEHQVKAFVKILEQMACTIEVWNNGRDQETLVLSPVPFDRITDLQTLIRNHQLFLDPDCSAALEIINDAYWHSRDFDDGSGGNPIRRDPERRLDDVKYLQPRIASLFQKKIGIDYDSSSIRQIGILGALRRVSAQSPNTDEKPLIKYLISPDGFAEHIVGLAESNINEVIDFLEDFTVVSGSFSETQKLRRYIQLVKFTEVV